VILILYESECRSFEPKRGKVQQRQTEVHPHQVLSGWWNQEG